MYNSKLKLMKKKLLRFVCTSLMTVVCGSMNATVYNGNCGASAYGSDATDAVTWSFDTSTGVLTFVGTGEIKTYYSDEYGNVNPTLIPWNNNTFNPTGGSYDYWQGITSIVIGEGITNIPDWAFAMQENCASISLPSTLTTIGASSLEECAFTGIKLPDGLVSIGEYAFQSAKITSITIPSSVTTISSHAFGDCKALKSVTFATPTTSLSIGDGAFYDCDALSSVICSATTPPTLGDDVFKDGYSDVFANLVIYVPAANQAAYVAAANWGDYAANMALRHDGDNYTFIRKDMTAGAHSTICLPFAYDKPASCTFYEFTGVTKNGSGEWEATFNALADSPAANTPYIFTSTATSLNITKTTVAVDYSATDPKTTVGDWVFQGTYNPEIWTTNPTGYYGYAGQPTASATAGQFVHLVKGASAPSFRAYLKCTNTSHELYKTRGTDEENAAETDLPQTIKVVLVDSFGDTTTIGTIDTRTGEMILDGDTWYSLDGKKLISKPTKKGVYINNGKTVLVK